MIFTLNYLTIIMKNKIYWFTGQPGSGKTTLGLKLKNYLKSTTKKEIIHIDGDELRLLFKNINYGKLGREENIKRAQDIAKFMHAQGYDIIVSLVAPYKEIREAFKTELGSDLIEIYVHTTEIRGREQFHSDEYIKPTENYVSIDTTNVSVEECLNKIKSYANL